jgi:hypothetical protein
MKIKICAENEAAIVEALAAVNGRARAFTIDSLLGVLWGSRNAEARLEKAGVPKARRGGTYALCRPAGPSARSYDSGAISTEIRVERGSRDWFLTKVERATVWPLQGERLDVYITAAARDDVVRVALAPFKVQTPVLRGCVAEVAAPVPMVMTHD